MRTALILALVLLPAAARAQHGPVALSEMEEEKIRDAAYDPALRVATFQAIIETRVKRLQDILANTRAQGRREDIQQNMQEIAGLANELEDNLVDYDKAHRDLRKPLPKLSDAILRWESVLKQPPDDASYNLTRKLALDAVADLKDDAKEMLPAEQAYFKEHPPDKNANPGGVGEINPRR